MIAGDQVASDCSDEEDVQSKGSIERFNRRGSSIDCTATKFATKKLKINN